MATIVLDSHVHLYPCYVLSTFLESAVKNLTALSSEKDLHKLLAFTERRDCNAFADLKSGKLSLPAGWNLQLLPEDGAIRLTNSSADSITVLAGRQIVTSEKIEVLALGCDCAIAEGLTLVDTLKAVSDCAGIGTLPYSPGKWLGGRGKLVGQCLEVSAGRPPMFGDTALRPTGISEPPIFSLARARGAKILAGTDSLPFLGEEARVGKFATMLVGDFEIDYPIRSLKKILSGTDENIRTVGQRCSLAEVSARLIRLKFQ